MQFQGLASPKPAGRAGSPETQARSMLQEQSESHLLQNSLWLAGGQSSLLFGALAD